jgi:hypothetical protein
MGILFLFFWCVKKGEGIFVRPYDLIHNILSIDTMGVDEYFYIIVALTTAVLSQTFWGNAIIRVSSRECIRYWISVTSFIRLFNLIWPWLQVNLKQWQNTSKGNQPIVAEIIMHCAFHYVSRGSIHAFMFVLGCQLHHFTVLIDMKLVKVE